MKLKYQSVETISSSDHPIDQIEIAARNCWKSEGRAGEISGRSFVKSLAAKGHNSVLEFADITLRVITNRAIQNEIVRHRIGCSYAVESSRYCSYDKGRFGGEVTFIVPHWLKLPKSISKSCHGGDNSITNRDFDVISSLGSREKLWIESCCDSEINYMACINAGMKAEDARDVLNHSVKSEMVVKLNFRALKHLFDLRCHKAAHPQIRQLFNPLRIIMQDFYPEIFK